MHTYAAHTAADPADAWRLIARPQEWPRWSPHVRGAWGLGEPEVEAGSVGAARLVGVLPVPARITAKRAGRSWAWRVGLVEMVHRVEPGRDGGALIAIDLSAPAPLEGPVSRLYGPVIELSLRRLARAAEER
jgi:hypothetical protein